MRFVGCSLVVFSAMLLASCGDVRSAEETREQFLAHRAEFEALAIKVQLCEINAITVAGGEITTCAAGSQVTRAEVVADMQRLGLKSARTDGVRLELVNGADGTDLGVMSRIIHYASPQNPDAEQEALTPAPHYWFYAQHD